MDGRADEQEGRHSRPARPAPGRGQRQRYRHRRAKGPQADRARQRRHDHGRRELRHRLRDHGRDQREEGVPHRPGRPHRPDHRQGLQVEHVPHLQHHRDGRRRRHRRAGEALRQEMVLHHAGLCLRPDAAGQLRQEPDGARRHLPGRHAADRQLRLLGHPDQGQGLQAGRAAEQHGRRGPDQLHEAVRAVRHEQGHGAGRRAVRDRVGALRAEGSPDRLVVHGMVLEPAGRAAGEAVRRRDFARDRRQEADGAPLDGLCLAECRASWRRKRRSRSTR